MDTNASRLISLSGKKYTLNIGRTIIGRDVLQCQIVLEQSFISRLQAVIEVSRNGQAAMKNLSNKPTTFVNRQPVDVCLLNDGDTIEFGAGQIVAFTFQQGLSENSNQTNQSFNPHISNSSLPKYPMSGGETMPFIQPPENFATSVFRVGQVNRLRIGRAFDNEIILDAPGVSRHHAELVYENGDGQPTISDLGSTNGTFVSGEVLQSPRRLLPTDSTPNDGRTIFIAAVIAIWLGANNAIREIVSETAVYERERLVNLKIPSYVLSKFAILSGIGLIQFFLFVLILTIFGRFETTDFTMLTVILYLSLLAGVAIGLFFSALVSSTEKAMSILPLILIPQLLLSGFLKPLDDLYVNLKTEKSVVVADYDKFKREEKDPLKPNVKNPTEIPKFADPIQKSEGLGNIKFLANLMMARWTIDALAHQVSINDFQARDKLAARMTVEEYENVLDKKSDGAIVGAYESRVRFDLMILALFSVLFLGLTIAALKRKDSL